MNVAIPVGSRSAIQGAPTDLLTKWFNYDYQVNNKTEKRRTGCFRSGCARRLRSGGSQWRLERNVGREELKACRD